MGLPRKLTFAKARTVRRWWATGEYSIRSLSLAFDVSQRTIIRILEGSTYKTPRQAFSRGVGQYGQLTNKEVPRWVPDTSTK